MTKRSKTRYMTAYECEAVVAYNRAKIDPTVGRVECSAEEAAAFIQKAVEWYSHQ